MERGIGDNLAETATERAQLIEAIVSLIYPITKDMSEAQQAATYGERAKYAAGHRLYGLRKDELMIEYFTAQELHGATETRTPGARQYRRNPL